MRPGIAEDISAAVHVQNDSALPRNLTAFRQHPLNQQRWNTEEGEGLLLAPDIED